MKHVQFIFIDREGQGQMLKIVFSVFTSLLPCFKVKVKGQGQGQRSGSRPYMHGQGQGQIVCVQRSILGAQLCRVQQRVKSHYQSKRFVCVSNYRADAVDWLLIFRIILIS